jgi:hypothetical protein
MSSKRRDDRILLIFAAVAGSMDVRQAVDA